MRINSFPRQALNESVSEAAQVWGFPFVNELLKGFLGYTPDHSFYSNSLLDITMNAVAGIARSVIRSSMQNNITIGITGGS